ncbi:MAG: hypothetical protein ACYTDW_15705 [Planctomycetota bacterium]|jgi:hypothetical protein
MNVNKVLTKDYEKWTLGQAGKTNPIQTQFKANQTQLKPIKCQNKPNSNPKQSQSNPISKQLQSPICPGNLLVNRMNQICCVCSLVVPSESAKMAQYTGNWNLKKDGKNKLNLLKCKRLNGPGRMRALTGTLFAHSNLQNFLYTDDTQ